MKKWTFLLGLLVLALLVVSCAPKENAEEVGEEGALAGEAISSNKCLVSSACSNIKLENVVGIMKDGGSFGSRGILTYEPDGTFHLAELVPKESDNTYLLVEKESFNLKKCGSKTINWPMDDCDTCTTPLKIRLIGYSPKENVAFLEITNQ